MMIYHTVNKAFLVIVYIGKIGIINNKFKSNGKELIIWFLDITRYYLIQSVKWFWIKYFLEQKFLLLIGVCYQP